MPPLDPTPIIQVRNLSVVRGHYWAVQDVSFELQAGTSAAIVGPNGAGKSTLVQAMLNLIPPNAGHVEIFGRPVARLGPLWHQIGYIPQNLMFDRNFPISVAELVQLGWAQPRSHRFPWQRQPAQIEAVQRALERVGLAHLQRRAIGTLSGGEMKRALLAYCLVRPRRLLVLDEVFAEIDVQGEADFSELLTNLMRQEDWTVLQISHDLDMVSRYCDQVLCLNRQLVCSGSPEVALSPDHLQDIYGPGFSRYYHHH